ncbi:hypothetical protein KUV57_12530 [Epibacterium sp. DP7N7-1]|nr:hypothetical protein [Epibacterium sp. DP7N7-1]
MKSITTAAHCAGAQEKCAQNVESVFRPIPRWTLYNLVEATSRHLRLNSGDLTALRAMLSFLPLKDRAGNEIPATHDKLLVCYASNASICGRAGGIDESSLRRHIRKLSAAGLVRRHDSATGKRFPLKRGGKVIDAYGIDLTPAFMAASELQRIANEIADLGEERRTLRTETLSLRRKVLDQVTSIDDAARAFLEGITNLLRRKTTTIAQISKVRDRLMEMLHNAGQFPPALPAGNVPNEPDIEISEIATHTPATSVETVDLPASDVQSARQVESPTLNKKNKQTSPANISMGEVWRYEDLLEKYPHAASFMPAGNPSADSIWQGLIDLGSALGIRQVPYREVLQSLGIAELMGVFDRMVERVETIRNPQTYFEASVIQTITERAACSS